MKLTPQISLVFNGQCEAAFTFYAQHLNATIVGLFKYAGSPMASQVPAEFVDKVMHATLTLDGFTIAGGDMPPSHYHRPQGFSVILGVAEPDDAERVFARLSENGTISVPIGETFWSARYGALIDQFGVPWEINCAKAPAGS
jgi:PhnB protein